MLAQDAGAAVARVTVTVARGDGQNAMKYNPEGHDVYVMAKKLLVVFPATPRPRTLPTPTGADVVLYGSKGGEGRRGLTDVRCCMPGGR